MKFIDHTGHIFDLKSYNIEPIGYEYEETKYVFWFDNEQGYKFSVDTYAIKPIRIVFDEKITDVEIYVNSQKFSLISSKVVEEKINSSTSGSRNVIFDENNLEDGVFTNRLDASQLYIVENLKAFNDNYNYTLVPFYVAFKSGESGVWQSNVLIHATFYDNHEEWCPFTIAIEVVDECEELIINGKNMGVYFPKEILKAIYQTSFNDDVPNERLYAQKLKEYLMNLMDIRGQIGNYKSAIDALKWFGWGDKLDLYKLIRTDNEFQAQYIRDDFDLANDTIYSYRFFKNEALVSMALKLDEVSEESAGFDFDNDFWGEDKPFLTDLLDKQIIMHYDEGDLNFYRPYFDFEFNELGLKLCMLKYYYEKYFLPLHLSINSLSMVRTVFNNDIKYVANCSPKITAEPVFIGDSGIDVKFPETHKLFLIAQYHEMDDNFIEVDFSDESQSVIMPKWKIYDTCVSVPITFFSDKDDQYYDTILRLYKDNDEIYARSFQFNLTDLIENPIRYEYERTYDLSDLSKKYYILASGEYIEVDEEFIEEHPDEEYYIRKYEHYLNFIIHPKTFNRYIGYDYVDENGDQQNKKFALNLWLDSKYKITVWANGNNYEYDFTMRLPDMGLKMSKLAYAYNDSFRQLYYEDDKPQFLSFMWNPNFVTIDNIDYVDDICFFQDELDGYIKDYVNKYYNSKPNFVDNKKYLNKCHLYKLLKNDEEVEYNGFNFIDEFNLTFTANDEDIQVSSTLTDLTIQDNLDLYKTFFELDNAENDSYVQYKYDISNVIENGNVHYDFYLMHDNDYWYVVLISKDTIDKFTANELKAPELPNIGNYSFEYDISDDKLLVNRFLLDETNGVNKFKSDDIIAMYLESNYKLPFKVGLSTKWSIKPLSIGMSTEYHSESSSEIAIISIGDNNFKYEKGYYSVVCRYSLDDFYQEPIEKKGIFVVDN